MLIDAKTLEEVNGIIAESKKAVVVLTAPSWCVPCRRLKPHVEAAAAKTDVPFVVVDVDEVADATPYWNVQSVPTVYVYQDQGTFVTESNARTSLALLSEVN